MSGKLYIYHALLNTIGIIFLCSGLYFAIKKPQNWFFKHRALMLLATVVLFISIFYALYLKEYHSSRTGRSSIHGHIGVLLGIILLIQVFIAITHRKELGANYLKVHKAGAMLIVILIIIQIYLGIKEYNLRKTVK
jgi:hypothetical protein